MTFETAPIKKLSLVIGEDAEPSFQNSIAVTNTVSAHSMPGVTETEQQIELKIE